VLVVKTTPKSEMARGFMDVRRAMEAMEGAYPNDPNRSILSLNKRKKGKIPPECHCGMNAGCKVFHEDETYGRRFWCCQNIDQAKKKLAALAVSDTIK
jgi:hypothetical protein